MFFYICYNLFSAGGEHIFCMGRTYNIFSAGRVFMHTKCHHQKGGECWNLLLMIHLWRQIIGTLSYKLIQEFYMIKTSQREWLWMCIVVFNNMLKALKHTHTHHYSLSQLIPLCSRLIHGIVDLTIFLVD